MDTKQLREFGRRADNVGTVRQLKTTAIATKRKGPKDYAFYGTVGLLGFITIGYLGHIVDALDGVPEKTASVAAPVEATLEGAPERTASVSAPVETKYDGGYLTEPSVIDRPGEPQATYTVRKVTYEGKGVVNVLHSRYSNQSGMWFTHAKYDCNKGTLFTLAGGETAKLERSGPDYKWSFLADGSSATQVAQLACKKAGLKLYLD